MENNHSDNGQLSQFSCPFCETLNNANAKFCRKCGNDISVFTSLHNQEQGNAVKSNHINNYCPNCGAINAAEAAFCKECGSKLTPVVVPVHKQQNHEQEDVEKVQTKLDGETNNIQNELKETIAEQQDIVCRNCGTVNNREAAFCKGCGQKLATEMNQKASDITVVKPLPTPAPVIKAPPEPAQKEESEIIKEPETVEPVKQVQETMAQAVSKYCPSCGASNKPDAGFCKECGQKLSMNNPAAPLPQVKSELAQAQQQNYINTYSSPAGSETFTQTIKEQPTTEEKKNSFSVKKLLIPLLCLILLLAGAGGVYLYKNGKLNIPGKDNPVKYYVEALNKNNYTAAYQMLNVKESAFVNAAQFEKFVKSQAGKNESVYNKLQGKLEKISTEKKRETQSSDVYEVKGAADGQPFSFMVELDKQSKKINLTETEFAPVELEAPPGTELKIDGVKLENGFKLDGLFAGKHSVEAQNPFLELGYNNNFNFEPEKQTKVKLVHTAWLKANQIGAVDNVSLSFINAFLKATITNESLKHETLKYKDDDSITNMYQKINTYMLKNGITEMVMTEGKTTNPVYAADGKIHSQYDFSGTYKKGQDGRTMNANGTIQLQFDIEGNDLIVSKVDSYSLHVKK